MCFCWSKRKNNDAPKRESTAGASSAFGQVPQNTTTGSSSVSINISDPQPSSTSSETPVAPTTQEKAKHFDFYIEKRIELMEKCMEEVERREAEKGSPLTPEEYDEIRQIFFAEGSKILEKHATHAMEACTEELEHNAGKHHLISAARIHNLIALNPIRNKTGIFTGEPCQTDFLKLEKGKVVRTISDLHIADPVWWNSSETSPQHTQIVAFLRNIIENKETVHTLVLIGDVFETWHRAAINEKPDIDGLIYKPSVKEFSASLAQAMDQGLQVVFLQGNHDNDVEVEFLNLLFSNYIGKQMVFVPNGKLLNSRILIAHGHEFDIFNSEDPITDATSAPQLGKATSSESPALWQPIGYYLARFWYTAFCRKGGASQKHIAKAGSDTGILKLIFQEIGDVLMKALTAAVTSKLLFSIVGMRKFIKLVLTVARWIFGIKKTDVVELYCSGQSGTATVKTITEKLSDQYETWYQKNKHDWDTVHNMLIAGFDSDYSLPLSFVESADLVIQGHTHEARVDQITRASGKGVLYYMNDGCWGIVEHEKQRGMTFGEIEVIDEEVSETGKKLKVKVSVKEMKDGESILHSLPAGEKSRAGITIENPAEIVLHC